MAIADRDWYRKQEPRRISVSSWSVVKILVAVNVACFLVQAMAYEAGWDPAHRGLGMKPDDVIGRFHVWQLFTSMFLHAPGNPIPWHLVFNMFVLWMFGPYVEQRLGKWSFFRFYMLAGLAAGLAYVVFGFLRARFNPAIGASGAIMGVLVYFTMMNPNAIVRFMFILPMKMKYATLLIVGMDLYFFAISPAGHGVANSAHLGGALFGFLYYRYGHRVDRYFTDLEIKSKVHAKKKRSADLDRLQAQVDEMLEKISREGIDGLSPRERKFLTEAGRRLREERP
ncbi:MAG: rhomboid family intramembrane serine protease [Planctomycetota bacterium]